MAIKIGDKAPSFTLIDTNEKSIALKDYSAKSILVVIFSCNHCPFAQAWEDRIVAIQDSFKSQDVQILVISSNDATQYPADSFAEMKKRALEKNFNFPYLYDETQEVAHSYGAEKTPEVFVFDQSRTLKYHGAIDDNYDDEDAVKTHYLKNALNDLLQNSTPTTPRSEPEGCTIKWFN